MSTTPSAYRTMISLRSRRLRTAGLLLLVAAVGMTLYGGLVLMPTLRRAIRSETRTVAQITAGRPIASLSRTEQQKVYHVKRVAVVQASFAYAYWTVCALMIAVLLLIAWLDLREVQRRYIDSRIALFAETARNLKREQGDRD